MKLLIRYLLFSYLSLIFVTLHFNGISFGREEQKFSFLVALGLFAIAILIKPVLKIMSLPTSGIIHLALNIFINIIAFYLLDRFLPSFTIFSGKLINMDFVVFSLNSGVLTQFWGYVIVASMFTVVFNFLNWLTSGKGK